MSLIGTLLDLVKKEMARPAPVWSSSSITHVEKRMLQRECQEPSPFDPYETRRVMMNSFDTLTVITKECPYGKITVLLDSSISNEDIPWELWGRILRMYGSTEPFRIYVLAHPRLRQFPAKGESIGPEHINGGYTYPCKKRMIMIYRAEDATRVLIHELQHASCLDHREHTVDQQEAETEAWAELIYIALLSEGSPARFRQLQRDQSRWMAIQNKKVASYLKTPTEFPWRYTIGKQEVWERWGIFLPPRTFSREITSLRLTVPPVSSVLRRWGVSTTSTLL